MSIDAIESTIDADLAGHLRGLVLQSLLKNAGAAKLAELVKFTEHDRFGTVASDISLQEIIDAYVETNHLVEGSALPEPEPAPARRKAGKKASKKTPKKRAPKKKGGDNRRKGGGGGSAEPGRQVNFRDPDERQRYSEGIETMVRDRAGEPVSSTELVDQCGGSSNQAREILKALVDLLKVVYVGHARATRYYWRANASAEVLAEFEKQVAAEKAGAAA